jgi:hypothetical protein
MELLSHMTKRYKTYLTINDLWEIRKLAQEILKNDKFKRTKYAVKRATKAVKMMKRYFRV